MTFNYLHLVFPCSLMTPWNISSGISWKMMTTKDRKLNATLKKNCWLKYKSIWKKKCFNVFLRVLILGIVGSTGLLITNNKSLIENVRQHNKAEKNIWQNIRIIADSIKNLCTVFLVDSYCSHQIFMINPLTALFWYI